MDLSRYSTERSSTHHSHHSMQHSHHSVQLGAIGWLSVCEHMKRRDERMHEINVDSKHIQILCISLIVASAILFFLGRGTFGLIQGVVGIIAGIEGYYGATEYSIKNIKALLIYLAVSTLFCIAMGVYSRYSIETYCAIPDAVTQDKCKKMVITWTVMYLAIGLVFQLGMIIAVLRFYWDIRRASSMKQGGRTGSLLD